MFHRGTRSCFTNFGCRKIFCFRGLCHYSLSKFFVSQRREKIVGEHFFTVFQKNSGSQKILDWRGGKTKISFENFLSHSAEKCCRGPISLSLISGIRKVWMRGWGGGGGWGMSSFSSENFLPHSAENFRRATL